jgi:hypothetical protein
MEQHNSPRSVSLLKDVGQTAQKRCRVTADTSREPHVCRRPRDVPSCRDAQPLCRYLDALCLLEVSSETAPKVFRPQPQFISPCAYRDEIGITCPKTQARVNVLASVRFPYVFNKRFYLCFYLSISFHAFTSLRDVTHGINSADALTHGARGVERKHDRHQINVRSRILNSVTSPREDGQRPKPEIYQTNSILVWLLSLRASTLQKNATWA